MHPFFWSNLSWICFSCTFFCTPKCSCKTSVLIRHELRIFCYDFRWCQLPPPNQYTSTYTFKSLLLVDTSSKDSHSPFSFFFTVTREVGLTSDFLLVWLSSIVLVIKLHVLLFAGKTFNWFQIKIISKIFTVDCCVYPCKDINWPTRFFLCFMANGKFMASMTNKTIFLKLNIWYMCAGYQI